MNKKDLRELREIEEELNDFYRKYPEYRNELMKPLANFSAYIARVSYNDIPEIRRVIDEIGKL